MQGSCDNSTPQTPSRAPTMQDSCENTIPHWQTPSRAPIRSVPKYPQATTSAQNTTPTTSSRANRGKKHKFYVVTRGRRTGVFDNW
jgi:hypothetical protein